MLTTEQLTQQESMIFRNRWQRDVDFLRLRSEITPKGILWTGWWLLRHNGAALGRGPDTIRIHCPDDWERVTIQ